MDGGGLDGKKLFNTGNQRKLRNFENSRAYLGLNVFKGETVAVSVSKNYGRLTHDFLFKVTPDTLSLRVSLSEGSKRVVSWINPLDSHKSTKRGNPEEGNRSVSWVDQVKVQRPVVVGPVVTKSQAQAPLAFPIKNKTHLEVELTCDPNGLYDLMVCGQDMSGSSESSTEPEVATVAPMEGSEAPMRTIPSSSPIPVVCTPISVAPQSDREPRATTEAPAVGFEAPIRTILPSSTVLAVRTPTSVAS